MKHPAEDASRVALAPMPVRREPTLAVLDTNVVLDWLVFGEPSTLALAGALADGRLRWIATAAMLAEQRHVFAGFLASRWQPDAQALEAACRRWAVVVAAPAVVRPPRCSDVDDQMFIDLALGHRARWLVTHDRALLKLARRMRGLGTEVLKPAAWAASNAP